MEGDPLGIVQEIEIWPYMLMQVFITENEMHKILWDFETQTDHLIPARRPELVIINKKKKKKWLEKKKRTYRIVDLLSWWITEWKSKNRKER